MALTIESAAFDREKIVLGDTVALNLRVCADTSDVTGMSVRFAVGSLSDGTTMNFDVCDALYVGNGETIPADGETYEYQDSFLAVNTRQMEWDLGYAMLQSERALNLSLHVVYEDGEGSGKELWYPMDAVLLDRIARPRIEWFSAERFAGGMAADDGEQLRSAVKISVAQGEDVNAFDLSLDWGETLDLNAWREAAQQGISESDELIPLSFSAEQAYTLRLRFGDAGEADEAVVTLPAAFANLHLSGKSTGGACFGGFSTAEEGSPKLESHYPAYFYGGIEGVTNFVSKETPTGGTWIDGKPIYRRVVTGSVTAGTAKTITYAASGVVDQVIRLDGLHQISWGWLPFTYYTESSNKLRIYATKQSVVFTSNVAGTVRVIIEYTKA